MPDLNYNWKRFWYPRGSKINLYDEGFLPDPNGKLSKYFNTDILPFESFADKRCLVLLGEPGIGKTYTVEENLLSAKERIEEQGDQTFRLDLNQFGSEERLVRNLFESPPFISWRNGKYNLHLFLDSVDECLLEIKKLGPLLVNEFQKYPHERLYIRVVCRTADWINILEDGLKKMWGEEAFGVYELAPLTKTDVIEAAKGNGLASNIFLNEIKQKGVEPLAIKPITLNFLINTYKRNNCFPTTQEELYFKGCQLLCEEANESRRDARRHGKFSTERKMIVASRIAAITVFANRYAIWTNVDKGDVPDEDFTIEDICGGNEKVNGKSFEIEESIIKETLATGLFSSRGSNRMGWAHQTFSEYLAAYYLNVHQLTLDQIINMLTHPGDPVGKIVPSLQETAAWLAGMIPDVFKEILNSDPVVLLQSDVAKADNKTRPDLVENLLRQYDEKIRMDNVYISEDNYRNLEHPELADQLRPYLNDNSKNFDVRNMAIDIAEGCRLQALVDDLIGVVLDTRQQDRQSDLRWNAAKAISHIEIDCTGEEIGKLKQLAFNEEVDDPKDELKGLALEVLWPSCLTLEKLFATLTPPKCASSLSSPYHLFILELITSLDYTWKKDIKVGLSWVSKQGKYEYQEDNPLWPLVDAILKQAWGNLDTPGVLEEFAKALLNMMNHKLPWMIDMGRYDKPDESEDSWLDNDKKRRCVLKTIVTLLSNDRIKLTNILWGEPRLFYARDFCWMLECLRKTSSKGEKKIWAEFISRVFNKNADQLNMVISACEEESVLHEEFAYMLGPVSLDSPEAKKKREQYLKSLERKNAESADSNKPLPSGEITTILDEFDAGDLSAWWRLNQAMAVGANKSDYLYGPELEPDLAKLPGWKNLDDISRPRIIEAAKKYLIEQDPETDKWLGNHKFGSSQIYAYRALAELFLRASHYLIAFSEANWEKWLPLILSHLKPNGDDSEKIHEKLITFSYKHVPDKVCNALSLIIDKENQVCNNIWITRYVKHCYDQKILNLLEMKLEDKNLKPDAMHTLFDDLLENQSKKARMYAESTLSQPIPPGGDDRKRAAIAAEMLMVYADDLGWPVLWPLFQEDIDFGKEVISTVAHNSHGERLAFVERLTEEQLADLYIWLEKQFPHTKDPTSVAGAAGPRHSVGWQRNSVLNTLKNRGTHKSCDGIRKIMKAFPEIDWLKRYLYEAQKVTLKQTWKPLPIKAILEIAENKDKRLVQNEQQLLEVLVESLKRMESKLHGAIPAARDIWDCTDKKNNKWRPVNEDDFSDYVKRHFDDDLKGKSVIVNREVQIHRKKRTDLHVDALSNDSNENIFKKLTVIIEVKGSWHRALYTAMKKQLAERYLKENICKTGIYLVGWFNCESWDKQDYRRTKAQKISREEAQEKFDKQAAELSKEGFNIRAVILDTSY